MYLVVVDHRRTCLWPEEGRVGDINGPRVAVGAGLVLDAPLRHDLVGWGREFLRLFGGYVSR